MQIRVLDFGDAERLVENFNESALRAEDTNRVMARIIEDIFRVERAIFASQGRRGGGAWKRLKPDTVRRKGGDTRILRTADDTLYRSVTQPGAPFQILRITNNSVELGTDRPWAGVHQSGSSKRKIPARPFLRFTSVDEARWTNWLADHIMAAFRAGQ